MFYGDHILFDTRTGLKSWSYSELTHLASDSFRMTASEYSPWSVGTMSGSSSNLTAEKRPSILGWSTGMALFPFFCGITSQRELHPRRTPKLEDDSVQHCKCLKAVRWHFPQSSSLTFWRESKKGATAIHWYLRQILPLLVLSWWDWQDNLNQRSRTTYSQESGTYHHPDKSYL
jgi:hypothetical protein